MTTPHINAKKKDFSEIMLMSGDPLRVKYIAKKFLSNVKEVNKIRNMLGYSGFYKGLFVSVMGHGIGIPSCSIYVKELITNFGIKKIIRIGSCGTIHNNINLKDIIIGMGASTDSKTNRQRFNNNDFAAISDFYLLQDTVNTANKLNIPVHIGNLFSTDLFYLQDRKILSILKKYNILGIEMESAGLYFLAAEFGIKALTICTVSDHLLKKECLTSIERQESFDKMILIALETIYIKQ